MKMKPMTHEEFEKQQGGYEGLVKKGYTFHFCQNCEEILVLKTAKYPSPEEICVLCGKKRFLGESEK